MAFQLPDLPYAKDALEPHIDQRTMDVHHGKHHNGYTTKLNAALEGTGMEDKPIEEILVNLDSLPADKQTAVRNNGGGYANHTLFWQIMSPTPGEISSDLSSAIDSAFGSMDDFKAQFKAAATGQFGSGWAWLVVEDGGVTVTSTPNQDTPLMEGKTPILGIDVWEHAYYLNYQNRRADYIDAWWNVVDWAKVSELYAAAK